MSRRISQQQLESYLWGAAVLLRGTIDAGDYKQFIFPLLFYKRLCDVFDEETKAALGESGGDETFAAYPENHRFQIPPDAHWSAVRQVAKNVGQALQSSMRVIETANPEKLYGIFGDAQWANKDRLSDAMLHDLIEHFSTLDLTLENLPEDELGQGYEYLIKKFADDSGHTAAEFYTNRTVVHLMTEMLEPRPGEAIYDPTCGSGGMLLSCITHLRRKGQEWRNVRLFGQERNLMTSSIARMNCFLHGIEDFQIIRGDTLSEPKFVEGDRLKRFDVVLANPPYSIKQWDRDAFAADPWGRNLYGTPPPSNADYAFFQHIICSLAAKTGRCAILFPHGVLFRDAESEMRRKLIDADLIECVVGLGMNLFYNSSMPSCVVICRSSKPKAHRGKILLINAVNEVTRDRTQAFLTEDHIHHIAAAYRSFKDEPSFARVVTRDEIRAHGGSLNLPLYIVAEPLKQSRGSVGELSSMDGLDRWLASRTNASQALRVILPSVDFDKKITNLRQSADSSFLKGKSDWRRVCLGDVAVKTEEVERNPLAAGFDRYLMVEHLDPDCLRISRWGNLADNNVPPTFYKVFRKGQVLYPTRNPHLRRAGFADFDGICGEKTLTLSPRGEIDPQFLPLVFQSEAFIRFTTNRRVGSTNPHVRWRDVAEFKFALPPLEQQRRIAGVLLATDEVLRLDDALLNSTQQALMAERDSLFSSTQQCETELVGNLFEVQLGKMLSPKAKKGVCPLPYLGNKNVQWEHFDLSNVQEMDFSPTEFEKFRLRPGDLLVCEGGEVGRSAIWDGQIENCCFQKAIHRLRAVDPRVNSEYMLEFMMWGSRKGMFSSLTGHSTIAHLPAVKLKSLRVPLVDRAARQRFLDRIRNLKQALGAVRKGRDDIFRVRSELLTLIEQRP